MEEFIEVITPFQTDSRALGFKPLFAILSVPLDILVRGGGKGTVYL